MDPNQQNNNLSYSQYPAVRHRSRKKKAGAVGILIFVMLLILLLFAAVIIYLISNPGIFQPSSQPVSETTQETTETTSETPETVPETEPETETQPERSDTDFTYTDLILTEKDMHSGTLILVNSQYPYDFDIDVETQTFYGNKNNSYKISGIHIEMEVEAMRRFNMMMAAFQEETDHDDLLVYDASRSYKEQEQIYFEELEQVGEKYASQNVAMPGHTDHHTFYAVDLLVFTEEGRSFALGEGAAKEYDDWMKKNAHEYGFVIRYPESKRDRFKVICEDSHYRYVGLPHSYYMDSAHLCLEEYIDALRSFPKDGKHLHVADNMGVSWEIYFVPATGDLTAVPVPAGYEYTVSGNNVDGFVIAVRLD